MLQTKYHQALPAEPATDVKPASTFISQRVLDQYYLSGPFSITAAGKPIVDLIGLDLVLPWFNSAHQPVEVGETRYIGNGLTAMFGFDVSKPNGECFFVRIDTNFDLYALASGDSDKQIGDAFFSTKYGWGDRNSATVFTPAQMAAIHLPGIACKDPVWWVPLSKLMIKPCYYSPGERTIIDLIAPSGLSCYGQKTAAQIRATYPDVVQLEIDTATIVKERTCITNPTEISARDFGEARDCLPPADWCGSLSGESFKCPEHFSGRVTSIYARVGDRYFKFLDLCTLAHEDIMQKCRLAERPMTLCV